MSQEEVKIDTDRTYPGRTRRQWQAHTEQRVKSGASPECVVSELVGAGWNENKARDLVNDCRQKQRSVYAGLALVGVVMTLFLVYFQYDLMNPKPDYYYPFRAEWDPALNLVLLVASAIATYAVVRRLLKLM